MLKRIMLYLMMLMTAAKFAALTFIFSTDVGRLPMTVYISTGIVLLFGVFLICKQIIKTVTKRDLIAFYILEGISVVVNLIFMKLLCRAELNLIDLLAIGTLMDIIVDATLVVLSARENRYVNIRVK